MLVTNSLSISFPDHILGFGVTLSIEHIRRWTRRDLVSRLFSRLAFRRYGQQRWLCSHDWCWIIQTRELHHSGRKVYLLSCLRKFYNAYDVLSDPFVTSRLVKSIAGCHYPNHTHFHLKTFWFPTVYDLLALTLHVCPMQTSFWKRGNSRRRLEFFRKSLNLCLRFLLWPREANFPKGIFATWVPGVRFPRTHKAWIILHPAF